MTATPVALSALHATYIHEGARLETRGAWTVPVHFTTVTAEVASARQACGLGELIGSGVIDVTGHGVVELATQLGVGDTNPGNVTAIDGFGGKARWARLTRHQGRILTSGDAVEAGLTTLGKAARAHATDLSPGLSTLVLVGPRASDLLARLIRLDLDEQIFTNGKLAMTGAAGVAVQIARWDRGNLPAYELTVGRDVAEYFAESLEHAGDDLGLRFIGVDALSELEG